MSPDSTAGTKTFLLIPKPRETCSCGDYVQLKGKRSGTVTSAWSWMNDLVGEDYWETGILGDQ